MRVVNLGQVIVTTLVLLNGALFMAVQNVRGGTFLRTCSVETATEECRCFHTIVQECDPEKPLDDQCEEQCVLGDGDGGGDGGAN